MIRYTNRTKPEARTRSQGLFARRRNYALVLLFLALLTYSLIGFSIQIPLAQAQEQPTNQEFTTGSQPRIETGPISSGAFTIQ